ALHDATSPMSTAALRTYPVYRRLTSSYLDPTDIRDFATHRLDESRAMLPALREAGPLVLFLPNRLDPADLRPLTPASRHVWLWAAFAELPELDRDAPSERGMRRLAGALGLEPMPTQTRARALIHADLEVVRALDPAEEVRQIVRGIAADLEHGVPLYRCA